MGGTSEEAAEPNLTPLLDLVLQLVMFFMLCANFVMEQIDDKIKLPEATSASSLSAKEGSLLYLNVDLDGNVKRVDGPAMRTPVEIETYLRNKFKDEMAKLKREKANATEKDLKTLVIVRGDERASFEKIFNVLAACRKVGFTRLQLRATIRTT